MISQFSSVIDAWFFLILLHYIDKMLDGILGTLDLAERRIELGMLGIL